MVQRPWLQEVEGSLNKHSVDKSENMGLIWNANGKLCDMER